MSPCLDSNGTAGANWLDGKPADRAMVSHVDAGAGPTGPAAKCIGCHGLCVGIDAKGCWLLDSSRVARTDDSTGAHGAELTT